MSSILVPVDIGRRVPYNVEIDTQDVPMRGLPTELHGATFVQLSDLHGGYGRLEAVYEEAIARVNALEPDYLFLTGDFIDDHCRHPDYPMADYLRRFRTRRGIYAVFGNHEHRRGIENGRQLLEKAGIPVLCNESVELVSGFRLAGIDDMFEGFPDIRKTFAELPDDRTSIVLSHNPRLIEKVPDRDVLILSGHTHGGQIVLPFLSTQLVVWFHLRCRQAAGWYRDGRTRLYVNRGLGVTGLPLRYGCPAEMGVFRMVPEPQATGNPGCAEKTLIQHG